MRGGSRAAAASAAHPSTDRELNISRRQSTGAAAQEREAVSDAERSSLPADTDVVVVSPYLTNGAKPHSEDDDDKPFDTPPSKRRKLDDASVTRQPSASRVPSPPWRRIAVDGPTSFVQEGRRKSSRTNVVPIEMHSSEKRQTRATLQQKNVTKSRYGGASLTSPAKDASTQSRTAPTSPQQRRPVGRPPTRHLTNNVSGKSPATKTTPVKSAAAKVSSQKLRPATSMPDLRKPPGRPGRPGRPRGRGGRPPARPPPPQTIRRSLRASKAAAEDDEQQSDTSGEPSSDLGSGSELSDAIDVDPSVRTPRLKFRVKMPKVPVAHPGHVLPTRKYLSFQEALDNDDPLLGEDVKRMTEEDAKREARMRLRIMEASRPGGPLAKDRCSIYLPDAQVEPDQQYAHHDHLVSQALHFRKLMNQEHQRHVVAARKLAYAAATEWKRRQPKTEAELEQEQRDASLARYKQLRKDLQTKWDMVALAVNRKRLVQWEEEQQVLGKQALNEMLEHSTQLLDARRLRRPSDAMSDEESEAESDDASNISGSGSEETGESNMSTSESERDDEDETMASGLNNDEDLTVDELRQKYAIPPEDDEAIGNDATRSTSLGARSVASEKHADPEFSNENGEDAFHQQNIPEDATRGRMAELEEVDDGLLDDSDDSVDMDDDMGESDRGSSSDEEEEEEEEDDEDDRDANPGLLGFLSQADFKDDFSTDKASPELDTIKVEEPEREYESLSKEDSSALTKPGTEIAVKSMLPVRHHHTPDVDHIYADPSSQASPGTNATTKPSEIDSASSVELHADSQHPSSATTPQPSFHLKTPIPPLLRGTLREYQHFGLDWLAGLYSNGTNGILADEMGLGKTIQTIALLAHLACVHEVWGPHLIVVPTSVMLNWEMEFKKWCPGFKILTYYGTQDERKAKRKGWTDDDLWNVVITSYQLVLQDNVMFRKRNWHYMVLDEAHNIKNFRSQRWQILLNFKTRARLLLTGTPLQNNLTELWSLLFFLMPSDGAENGIGGFADLQEFTDWFRKPVEQILEHGRDTMDDEAKNVVAKLHKVLRPYLLRRLKADVEKQMPAKHEHVVYCRLSKRQRYLYDGFMALGQTRETLNSGNYLSIINCLMQLRKVCNHPDLFETRQIVTSFAMPKAAVADFEVKELLVRRRLLQEDPMTKVNLGFLNLTPTSQEHMSKLDLRESSRIIGVPYIQDLCRRQVNRINWRQDFDASTTKSALDCLKNAARIARNEELRHAVYLNALRGQSRPIYGKNLIDICTIATGPESLAPYPTRKSKALDWYMNTSDSIRAAVPSILERSQMMEPFIQKFGCITPSVTAMDMPSYALSRRGMSQMQQLQQSQLPDPFHEARIRLSIAFPDKRLLQYDCGKLQRLDKLLRELQAGGHRALIFTQMTKVLDLLEQFLNIHGHRYLRLDGNTKVEQRQVLTERFNSDTRILAFILSSRSGGLGINLTGADTVIFYDLDWNPAMDKQCQDRCHRIGQTRDVHIYRFVSEFTIEANILRKANQKRMLDDVVIQEGEFTTDYFNKLSIRDMLGDDASTALEEGDASASAAMDRILGNSDNSGGVGKVLEQVEDVEDTAAARMAEKEVTADNADFDEKGSSGGAPTPKDASATTPRDSSMPPPPQTSRAAIGNPPATTAGVETTVTLDAAESGLRSADVDEDTEMANDEDEDNEPGHVDEYMLRFVEWEVRDVPVAPALERSKARKKAKKAHHIKRVPK
ncbi:MAG: hypothetical protein M4579_002305 [Chaenotheca gracillima]|nr:MAG: hypothetical protein M4579_002305 [Chaenotheca gracillima]